MTSWEFNLPVTLEFGVGKRKEIKSYIDSIGGKNGVLVCSHSFSKNGVADEFVKMSEGTLKAVFADIRPNPTTLTTASRLCAKSAPILPLRSAVAHPWTAAKQLVQ